LHEKLDLAQMASGSAGPVAVHYGHWYGRNATPL
jgi:hypothetical protein